MGVWGFLFELACNLGDCPYSAQFTSLKTGLSKCSGQLSLLESQLSTCQSESLAYAEKLNVTVRRYEENLWCRRTVTDTYFLLGSFVCSLVWCAVMEHYSKKDGSTTRLQSFCTGVKEWVQFLASAEGWETIRENCLRVDNNVNNFIATEKERCYVHLQIAVDNFRLWSKRQIEEAERLLEQGETLGYKHQAHLSLKLFLENLLKREGDAEKSVESDSEEESEDDLENIDSEDSEDSGESEDSEENEESEEEELNEQEAEIELLVRATVPSEMFDLDPMVSSLTGKQFEAEMDQKSSFQQNTDDENSSEEWSVVSDHGNMSEESIEF